MTPLKAKVAIKRADASRRFMTLDPNHGLPELEARSLVSFIRSWSGVLLASAALAGQHAQIFQAINANLELAEVDRDLISIHCKSVRNMQCAS